MKIHKNFIYISQINFGGAERVVIDYLNNTNNQFILVTDKKNSNLIKEIKKKIKILHLNVKFPLILRLLLLLIFIIRHKPDKIISHLTHCNLHVLLLKKIFKIRTKIYCYEHTTFSKNVKIDNLKNFLIYLGTKNLYHLSTKIIAVSETVRSDLYQKLSLNLNQIDVIYNPIDFENLINKSKYKVNFKFNKNFKYIVFVGRLEKEKDPLGLIEIFSNLNKKYPSCYKLLIFGDGSFKNKISNLIKKLNLKNDIYLFGFNSNPYSYMINCDILILPSKYEGFGLVLIEALFFNLKIVCRKIEATEELLFNIPNTYFSRNTDDFIKIILKVKNYKFKKIDKSFFNKFSIQSYIKSLDSLIN